MNPFEVNNEILRNRFLSDADLARVHQTNPKLRHNYEKYCPTCSKKGFYVLRSVEYPCDCQMQHQLATHYTDAGIGDLYQRYTWSDLSQEAAPELRSAAYDYLAYAEGHVRHGQGLVMLSSFGRGKTLTGNLLLKSLMWQGYTVFFTTFTNMIEMFTDGWKDKDDKRHFVKKLKNSDAVMIDDIGKEFMTKNNLAESTFDDVLRHRVHNNKLSIISSNSTEEGLRSGYGGAIFSMLMGTSYIIDIPVSKKQDEQDYRRVINAQKLEFVRNNWVRPIV